MWLWSVAWAVSGSEERLGERQGEPDERSLLAELDLTDPDGPETDAIVGGAIEEGYPSAVGLGAGAFTVCSGSLITPRMVLTAAHCGAGLPIELVVELGSAFVGSDAAEPKEILKFIDAVIHPGYRELNGSFLGENDVSVLVLAEEAKASPVWFRTEPLKPNQIEGEEVISVGWGLDEQGRSNVKRSATLTIGSVDPMFLVSYSSGNENNANICSGDSGGPQYHVEEDGTLVQWAVHSWGDQNCQFESGSTRTDKVAGWILEQVERVHGTTDRCEIFGQYGDGTCHTDCPEIDEDCIEPVAEVETEEARQGCGCSGGGPTASLAGLALALTLLRRRR